MQKEATARIKINNLLQESGWRFFDDENGQANIVLEQNAKLTQRDLDEFGHDFEKTKNGYIDFLLLDENGFPFVILEAKSEDKNPLDGKEQARRYARSQNTRFIILSNGNLHYFWDLESGNPTIITTFPTPESIGHVQSFKPDPQSLTKEKVDEGYIAQTQYPAYETDPRWLDPEQKPKFIKDNNLKILRPYQLGAVFALQNSIKAGRNRFLFEMATGTGKTLVAAAIIKLFLRSGNARRILFLVDRLELETQGYRSMVRYLKNDYTSVIYKENRDDWKKAEIVISTVQSLLANNKYQRQFSPTDFDLVISDEAHRSISGNSRAVFEYFVGYKLGLTATPKDYLKNLDPVKVSQNDPRQWERRQLLDTYRTFGCESGEPTYRYALMDGVKDGYLVNPIVTDARTEITTQLLSDKGYAVMVENEDGELEEQIFLHKDFEKKFFSKKTNNEFCQTFLKHALRDPVTDEIGKTIIFCVSQNHANKITELLNHYANKLFPGKYNSDFAVQITSRIGEAQQMSLNFANNNLNGQTKFLDGYISSKTRVCVTVGMMTTGYDCEDILNLCLMRPIFSPTYFIQMKGRGTRLYFFKYEHKQDGQREEITKKKERFKLFDFFANCEYFEEKFNYDEVLELPKRGTGEGLIGPTVDIDKVIVTIPDPLKTLTQTPIGLKGMKVDRKLFESFEEKVKKDNFIRQNYNEGNIDTVEEYIKEKLFDKPEDYINLEKLRQSARLDRRLTLREVIDKVFGQLDRFKTKDELLEEEFSKFILTRQPDSERVINLKNYFKTYVTDPAIRQIIDEGDFAQLATNPKLSMAELKELGREWQTSVPEYVKDYVSINRFL